MEDLIRRSDAIKVAKSFLRNDDEWFQEALASQIRMIPSAESTGDLDNAIYEYVQDGLMSNPYDRPQGEWIYCEDEYGIDGYRCSNCGRHIPWDCQHKFINFIDDYHTCPFCDARMKGADDE